MPIKYSIRQLRRYDSIDELMEFYASWIKKNGKPKLEQGCINCAELICHDNCIGITDKRVKILLKKGA